MCRLAAFPPLTSREKAIEIVNDFCVGNDDGVGTVYVKEGQFVVNKAPVSFERAMKKHLPLFDHMPYNGWTLAHVRAASHGANTMNNTHPFIKGDWAFIHNGIYDGHALIRAALSPYVKFDGETDTEVVAHMFATLGPQKFIRTINDGGVYMALNKQGHLYVVKTSGSLAFRRTNKGLLLASEFPPHYSEKKITYVDQGWMRLTSGGQIESGLWVRDPYGTTNYRSYGASANYSKDLWTEEDGDYGNEGSSGRSISCQMKNRSKGSQESLLRYL